MNWAEIKTNDIANGEGVRTSLFVSGCRHHCKNCFNEITWDFSYGHLFTEETMEDIFKSVDHSWINGISLLGGEPFEPENQKVLVPFLVMFHEKFPDKTVWCYTGFTLEQILGCTEEKSRAATDISKEKSQQKSKKSFLPVLPMYFSISIPMDLPWFLTEA